MPETTVSTTATTISTFEIMSNTIETGLTPAEALEAGIATAIRTDESAPVAQAAKRDIMQRLLAEKPTEQKREPEPAPAFTLRDFFKMKGE